MIRVLVCDDDYYTVKMLEKIISENPIIDEVVTFENGQQVVEYVGKEIVHIALLDIDMPKLDGIETAKLIYDISPSTKIIFVTAFSEYATDSFKVHPFDYILKPIEIERVREDINKIVTSIDTEKFNYLLDKIGRLLIRSEGEVQFIDLNDIFFIEKNDKLTLFHTREGVLQTYIPLHSLEKTIEDNFYRVHRSYIVNLKNIKKISPFSESSFIVHFDGYEQTALITKAKFNIIKDSIL
jgi:two-component system LytT family response regulator